jgi:hypothetical protein
VLRPPPNARKDRFQGPEDRRVPRRFDVRDSARRVSSGFLYGKPMQADSIRVITSRWGGLCMCVLSV